MTAPLPTAIEVCARLRDGGLPCLGLVHRPRPETTYCVRCGAVEAPVARYALAEGAA